MNLFKDEIIDAHIAIENWLGKGEGDHDALMAHFCEGFTMVTPTGACLDYPSLSAFFMAQRGSRPGLSILVDNVDVLEAWPDGAVLCYREVQRQPSAPTTLRWSTVVLRQQGDSVLWRHLHETVER
ncbi:DUF4440 domain-containing protein [Lelliottia amnigena]|jgi:hypothetical protein|uniref:DUF4440 domain-containing protein n=1 Tax=Lelliottia amnigena TaxID=61646 RepID=UPI000F499C62